MPEWYLYQHLQHYSPLTSPCGWKAQMEMKTSCSLLKCATQKKKICLNIYAGGVERERKERIKITTKYVKSLHIRTGRGFWVNANSNSVRWRMKKWGGWNMAARQNDLKQTQHAVSMLFNIAPMCERRRENWDLRPWWRGKKKDIRASCRKNIQRRLKTT